MRILFSLVPLENPNLFFPHEREKERLLVKCLCQKNRKKTGSPSILQSCLSGCPRCCCAFQTSVWFISQSLYGCYGMCLGNCSVIAQSSHFIMLFSVKTSGTHCWQKISAIKERLRKRLQVKRHRTECLIFYRTFMFPSNHLRRSSQYGNAEFCLLLKFCRLTFVPAFFAFRPEVFQPLPENCNFICHPLKLVVEVFCGSTFTSL